MTRQHRLALDRPKFPFGLFSASSDHPLLAHAVNWSVRILFGIMLGVGAYMWDARTLLRESEALVRATAEIQRTNLTIQREMSHLGQCARGGPAQQSHDIDCLKRVSAYALTSSTLYAISHRLGAATERTEDADIVTLRKALLKRAISAAMTEKEQPHVQAIRRIRTACDEMILPCPFYPGEEPTAMSDFVIGAASRDLWVLASAR